ncbi:MAG TPA: thiamine phosphate synthase [Armatimonadota bacterium]|jgi:thiamine-phosphate diphosphorylase
MSRLPEGPILIVLTDPGIPDLDARVEAAIAGGARWVQFRDRSAERQKAVRWVRRMKESHPDVTVSVNYDLMAAHEANADGFHMPAGVEWLADARMLLGFKVLIGRSVHPGEVEPEVNHPHAPGLDYVTFGSVFPTESHAGGPVTGLAGLRHACLHTEDWGAEWDADIQGSGMRNRRNTGKPLPVIAIGGIDESNAGDCIRAGAAGAAVIRSVLLAPDPAVAVAGILKAMREAV